MNKKFLELNEKELYNKSLKLCKCNYPGCKNQAINSHTYPQSYLKKFTKNIFLYATDIELVASKLYSPPCDLNLVSKMSIKKAGAKPLFCSTHDSDVFREIESNEEIDVENYLFLFLYRAFIYDYVMEKNTKNPIVPTQILKDKDYAKKISEKDEKLYLFNRKIVQHVLRSDYDFDCYEVLKNKLDTIIIENSGNSKKRMNLVNERFGLRYFKIDKRLDFMASGTMTFRHPQVKPLKEECLPSIYALVPDKSNRFAYFSILFPLEEKESMEFLYGKLEKEYNKYQRGMNNEFIKDIEFLLLDASQNILLNEKLYEKLKKGWWIRNTQ